MSEPIHGPYCSMLGDKCVSAHCKHCGRPHSMWTGCGCTPDAIQLGDQAAPEEGDWPQAENDDA